MVTEIRPIYILSTRDLLESYRHTQAESQRMEKGIPSKWKSNESQIVNCRVRKNRP